MSELGPMLALAAAGVGTIDELAPPVLCCGVRWTSDVSLMRSGAGYGWTRHRRCGVCSRDLGPGPLGNAGDSTAPAPADDALKLGA
jgi:hypothetical protein